MTVTSTPGRSDAGFAPTSPRGAGDDDRPSGENGRGAGVRRWRWPTAVALVVLLAGSMGLLLLRPSTTGALDPGNVAPDGARALAEVLRGHGVDVLVRDRFDEVAYDLRGGAGSDVTVVVTRPELVSGARGEDLRRAVVEAHADLVLVGAGPRLLADLDLPVAAAGATGAKMRRPACQDPLTVRAGEALTGGTTYSPNVIRSGEPTVVTACYPTDDGFSYVAIAHPDGRTTTLLGSGAALTNDRLDDAGDAALAVGALGRHDRLVWWTPSVTDGGVVEEPPSLLDLVPDGVRFAALQLLVVLLVVVLWRGRRLGRLVREPLPVVVRASETTRGRATLYRRARARGRAAQVLRAAAVGRIAVRCGLPRTAEPREVAAVAALRTGRHAADITPLLVGPDPADDRSLVQLARDLDTLETEVRHP